MHCGSIEESQLMRVVGGVIFCMIESARHSLVIHTIRKTIGWRDGWTWGRSRSLYQVGIPTDNLGGRGGTVDLLSFDTGDDL